jgi:5-methylthioribose kinase
MLELTADNSLDYLRAQGWLDLDEPAQVTALSGGVSNAVLRVEAPKRTFILKQSRPQLRTRDAWFSDLDRVYREQDVMRALADAFAEPVVPRVLHSDRANYVFAMSHAPAGARVWKELLLAGQVDLSLGERSGVVLGRIHEFTAGRPTLTEPFRDRAVFVQLRVEPYYHRVRERRPEVAAGVAPLVEQLLSCQEALCHGDFSPKNLLTCDGDFTLVDYETAHLGDPTMDLGFFLSHLLLKAVRRSPDRQRYFDLTQAFWRGYAAEVGFRPLAELQARGIGHLGVCLLARIDGTSPVEYLSEEPKREVVRRLGRSILLDRPASWDEVLRLAETEIGSLL